MLTFPKETVVRKWGRRVSPSLAGLISNDQDKDQFAKLKGHLNVLIAKTYQRSLAQKHYRYPRGRLMFRCKSMRSYGKWCVYLSGRWLADSLCLCEAGGSCSLAVCTDTQRSLAEEKIIRGEQKIKPFNQSIHHPHQRTVGDQRLLGLRLYFTQVAIRGCKIVLAVPVLWVRNKILASILFSDTRVLPGLHP